MHPPPHKTQIAALPDSSSHTGATKTGLLDNVQQMALEHPIMSTVGTATIILGSNLLLKRHLIRSMQLSKNLMATLELIS